MELKKENLDKYYNLNEEIGRQNILYQLWKIIKLEVVGNFN